MLHPSKWMSSLQVPFSVIVERLFNYIALFVEYKSLNMAIVLLHISAYIM